MMSKLFSVWEGVYSNFKEAGGDSDAFDSDIWISKAKERLNIAIKDYNHGNFVSKDYPLSIIVAMLLSCSKNNLSILDFGGGMGLQYIKIITEVPKSEDKIDYYVVDCKSSINNRPDEINQFKKIYFFSDLSNINKKMDIIHIGSTLQYIEDWQNLLLTLNNKFKPTYFVFSDIFVGNIKTFVSHQIFYSKKIPHWFINIHEFKKFMKQHLKMQIIFKTKFISSILNQEDIFPNFGLPVEFGIDRPYNLMFALI